ncbi:MAG: hypothetical protein AAGA97_02930 [Pseudomonadota bacterium]
MYCPEGYTLISTLLRQVQPKVWSRASEIFSHELTTTPEAGTLKSPDDSLIDWLLCFCDGELRAAAEGSPPLKIDTLGFKSFGLMVPRLERSKLDEKEWSGLSLKWNICNEAVDESIALYIGKSKQNSITLSHGCITPILFYEWETGRFSLELYYWLKRNNLLDNVCLRDAPFGFSIDSVVDLVMPLDGRFMCVPDKLIGEKWENYWNSVGIEELSTLRGRTQTDEKLLHGGRKTKGRPPILPEVTDIMEKICKFSVKPKTNKQLEKEISKVMGRQVSPKTIDSAKNILCERRRIE